MRMHSRVLLCLDRNRNGAILEIAAGAMTLYHRHGNSNIFQQIKKVAKHENLV